MIGPSRRLSSIDAFRAITMLLMIFVNDLELLQNVPKWLEHAAEGEDRLGLADTVFPAFLFIVGLSIPFAIRQWESKGASTSQMLGRILNRSFALLVMGVYAVNYEEYTTGPALISQYAWLLLAVIGFFFIWLNYPAEWSRVRVWALRSVGILLLVVLAIIYKGGTPAKPHWMELFWYGILGLIGWCYLYCALFYLYIRDRLWILGIIFLFFVVLSIADNYNGLLDRVIPHRGWVLLMNMGGLPAFTMAGVMTGLFYSRRTVQGQAQQGLVRMWLIAPVLVVVGFVLRPFGGIAKLGVTPSWILICTGISIAAFALLAYVVDLKGKDKWYAIIRPAGTSTLTCYLLSYMHYCIFKMLPASCRLPLVLRSGDIGLIKSAVFAFLIVWLTGVLEKGKIRLSV